MHVLSTDSIHLKLNATSGLELLITETRPILGMCAKTIIAVCFLKLKTMNQREKEFMKFVFFYVGLMVLLSVAAMAAFVSY